MLVKTKCDQELFNAIAEDTGFCEALEMLLKSYNFCYHDKQEAIKQIVYFINEAEGYL